MAGQHSALRPTSSSSSVSTFSLSSSQSFASRLLLLLTVLSLTLACFAFILQWRGGLNDPITRWSLDHHEFPGMAVFGSGASHSSRSVGSDCVDLLGQSRSPTFPYFRDWKFGYESDLNPKVSVWLEFDWMVIGVLIFGWLWVMGFGFFVVVEFAGFLGVWFLVRVFGFLGLASGSCWFKFGVRGNVWFD